MKTTAFATIALLCLCTLLRAQSTPAPSPAATSAAPLDRVVIGDDASESSHGFMGDTTQTGTFEGRLWRDGRTFQYTLDTHGEKAVDAVVTYWGGDDGREFDVFANDNLLATEQLRAEKPGQFIDRRYPIPAEVIASASDGRVSIKFEVKAWVAGGVFDLRLEKTPKK